MEIQYDIFNKQIKVYLKKGINITPYKDIIDLTTDKPFLFGYFKRITIEKGAKLLHYPEEGKELLFVDHKEINEFNNLTKENQLAKVIRIPFGDVISFEVLFDRFYQ
jgi:hypothetical protein